MSAKPPITSEQVSDQWVKDCREAMSQHEGVPIRANPSVALIDAWSIARHRWMPIMVPGSGTLFTTVEERNLVLERLNRPTNGQHP